MRHLGDITKINGAQVEPVNVVIGGSPCQDLSIAGHRAGLAGERSGLFMEQLRVIKEMRLADVARGRTGQNVRPRWMVWENVPGAFSSNGGEDFAAVIQETIKVVCPEVPPVPLSYYGGDGPQVDASRMWEDNGALRGEYSMHSFGVRPSAVVVSRLSQILVASPPPKYCLSARACLGILTRAKRRGRPLPVPLERALQRQALGLTPPPTLSVCGQDETGGGKGALVQVERSGTLGCSNDQTVICMATQQGGAEIRCDDKAPTLTAAAGMSGNNQPIICLNDQGGDAVGVSQDVAGTLRAQEHGHQPSEVQQLYRAHPQDCRISGPCDVADTVTARYGTGGGTRR